MDRAGFQLQIGSASSSRPCVGSGVSTAALTGNLPFTKADSTLRVRRVRLQSSGDLQFHIFTPKLSKCRTRCFVAPRAKVEELSTAEEVGHKNGALEEDVRATEGSGMSKFSDSESPATAEDEDSKSFDWLAQWYPVGVLKHMDKRQPYPVTVLGRDLVMWYDKSGDQWQVFADVCPHRLAPLSEGRINEQGHLQCSYHGWSFAPSGECTLIPQAPADVFEKKNSKRSCATTYRSMDQQGLLWVYMDASVGAEELPAGNSPPFIAELSDPDFVFDLGMSDLAYGYEALTENLLDPAHVPFAHHGLQGNRNAGRPLNFLVDKSGKTGFAGSRDGKPSMTFIAPCMAKMDFVLPPPSPPKGHPWALKLRELIMSKKSGAEIPPKQISTLFFCVPSTPEKSRVIFTFPRNFAKLVHKVTPRWLGHLTHMTVLDSDSYFLHMMERKLEEGGGIAKIEKLYYTPTQSDAFVVAFRRWLKVFAGSVPDYGPKASARLAPSQPKTVVMDRYSLHVAHCSICSGAMRNFKALEAALHVLPFVLVGLAAASNVKPLRGLSGFSIPLICTAIFCSVAEKWLQGWIKKNYEYHGYNHALVK